MYTKSFSKRKRPHSFASLKKILNGGLSIQDQEVTLGAKRRGPSNKQNLLQEIWSAVMGNAFARNTWPGVIRTQCLTIYASGSSWLNELHFYHDRILQRLTQYRELGPIMRLTFKLGRKPPPQWVAGRIGAQARQRQSSAAVTSSAAEGQSPHQERPKPVTVRESLDRLAAYIDMQGDDING